MIVCDICDRGYEPSAEDGFDCPFCGGHANPHEDDEQVKQEA